MGVSLPRDPINNAEGDDVNINGEYGYRYQNLNNQSIFCFGKMYELIYQLETDKSGGGSVKRCGDGTANASDVSFMVGMTSAN
jgi:hypothetical protein